MTTTIAHRGLTVWINPVERSARIRVHMPGYDDIHIVIVKPTDGGWTVADDREDEPIWFGTFEQALGEAVACGAQALEERLLAELRQPSIRDSLPPEAVEAAAPCFSRGHGP
jgi:hypothetical protein